MTADVKNNKHLFSRAAFGVSIADFPEFFSKKTQFFINKFLETKDLVPIKLPDSENLDYMDVAKLNADEKKMMLQKNRRNNVNLNIQFFNQMVNSEAQLQEKMAFFWHGHFATRVINANYNQQILKIFRENSLSDFRKLLFEVSKSAAMLQFLNNQQNKKGHPNENFAREVMELFTLGRGNYTETDIREAARAFTGWSHDKDGNFVFRMNQHDTGTKTFLGKTGNFTGDDILNIILEKPAASQFITKKILRFFIEENPQDEQVSHFAKIFYDSNYDIKKLLESIFTSNYFFDSKNVGNKIKSPIELMAGILRVLPMDIKNPRNLTVYQQLLGQMLLYPPNVSGWPSGKGWIDSSTLMLRMQIPQIWTGLKPLEQRPKSDDDLDVGLKNNQDIPKNLNNLQATVDWQSVENAFSKHDPQEILLQNKNINPVLATSGGLRDKIIKIMSSPDYQLC